ncbi:MAG: hypothetical protein AAF530_25140 [Pseudomonadota bacterium]
MRECYSKPKGAPLIVKTRRCLMCSDSFPSEGAHNRVCSRCRGSQRWRDGW